MQHSFHDRKETNHYFPKNPNDILPIAYRRTTPDPRLAFYPIETEHFAKISTIPRIRDNAIQNPSYSEFFPHQFFPLFSPPLQQKTETHIRRKNQKNTFTHPCKKCFGKLSSA